jgi:hypothetical protein
LTGRSALDSVTRFTAGGRAIDDAGNATGSIMMMRAATTVSVPATGAVIVLN